MTGKVVTFYSNPRMEHTFANVTDAVSQNLEDVAYVYTPMQIATAVTLMVGIFQVNTLSSLKVYFSQNRKDENRDFIITDNNVYVPIRYCNNFVK